MLHVKQIGHGAYVLQHTNGKLNIYTIYRWRYAELGGASAYSSSPARWHEGRVIKVVTPLVFRRNRDARAYYLDHLYLALQGVFTRARTLIS